MLTCSDHICDIPLGLLQYVPGAGIVFMISIPMISGWGASDGDECESFLGDEVIRIFFHRVHTQCPIIGCGLR